MREWLHCVNKSRSSDKWPCALLLLICWLSFLSVHFGWRLKNKRNRAWSSKKNISHFYYVWFCFYCMETILVMFLVTHIHVHRNFYSKGQVIFLWCSLPTNKMQITFTNFDDIFNKCAVNLFLRLQSNFVFYP